MNDSEKLEIRNIILKGLRADDAYHKQWFLEEALIATVGIDEFQRLFDLNPWEEGEEYLEIRCVGEEPWDFDKER